MPTLAQYEPIVGKAVVEELRLVASRLAGCSVVHVNSTAVGGGVAEILSNMVPLLRELGIQTRWEVIKGGEAFFNVTKRIHNALHGAAEEIAPEQWDLFWATGEQNAREIACDADIAFIHDPQPIALVAQKAQRHNRWIWRCHVDVAHARDEVWEILKRRIVQYDAAVFSAPSFSKPLPIRQFLIPPSIDPLSDKNRELPDEVVEEVLAHYGITSEKPIVTQISRFDALKDPLGVIDAFRSVKRYVDCQLILAGGTAADDPEGVEVFARVRDRAADDPDIHVLLVPQSDLRINALQRASRVIVQKSLREGFGLTVTEALWKGKPVVASAVGGIPLQIKHKYHGMLCHSVDGAAFAIKQLLQNPAYAAALGANGREHVRQNYLLTRHLKEYLLMFLALYHAEDVIHL